MSDIAKFVEKYSSTFEACLLAADPHAHIQDLPDSFEKNLLLFLNQEHSEGYGKTLANKYKLSYQLIKEIDEWKAHLRIQKAQTPEEVRYLIDDFVKKNSHSFNATRPADYKTETTNLKPDEKALSSTLPEHPPLAQWAADQLKEKQDNFDQLSNKAIRALGGDKIKTLSLRNKLNFLGRRELLGKFPDDFVLGLIKDALEEDLKQERRTMNIDSIISDLSKTQFNLLEKYLPDVKYRDRYLEIWFRLNFEEELANYAQGNLTISEKDEKRKLLVRVLKEVQSMDTIKLKRVEGNLMKEILVLDLEREDVHKETFFEFLENESPEKNKSGYKSQDYQASKKKQKKMKYMDDCDFEREIYLNVPTSGSSMSDDKIGKEYIERLLKLPDHLETKKKLISYFPEKMIEKIHATARLNVGDDEKEAAKILSADELAAIKNQKEITILSSNKSRFKTEEPVQFKVQVKNVKNILTKVYEIDLEKHYLQNGGRLNELEDVSYLQPNKSSSHVVENQNPYKQEVFDLKIEGIPLSKGVWIVELEGEGISSRAFVQKGVISAIPTDKTSGVEVKFYGDDGRQIEDLDVWMDGKKHKVDKSITLPYGTAYRKVRMVAVKDKYAESIEVNVARESYRLEVGYIYGSESFLVGNKARVVLHPRLFMEHSKSTRPSLKLLEKVKVSVTTRNNKGISSTTNFDNVQLKTGEDYNLDFPIQSYCQSIVISVSATVKKLDGKEETLTNSHTISINLGENSTTTVDLYLRNEDGKYLLEAIGLNGEKIPGQEVNLMYTPDGWSRAEEKILVTDAEGKIHLGALKSVPAITAIATFKKDQVSRSWVLIDRDSQVSSCYNKIYAVGESIKLPILAGESFQLRRLNNGGTIISDESKSLKVNGQILEIEGLQEGIYRLEEPNGERVLQVVKGDKWEGRRIYNPKQNIVYKLPNNSSHLLGIGEATFTKEENHIRVEVPIESVEGEVSGKVRCHVLASNYISPAIPSLFSINQFRQEEDVKTDGFTSKETTYYNNKQLSDEASYVVNRENSKKYVGNNLQKPRMFLKRIEVQETHEEDEVLQAEGDYRQEKAYARKAMAQNCMMSSSKMAYDQAYRKKHIAPQGLTSHNNFIAQPAYLISNQKGTKVQFKLPLGYSHIEFYVLSDTNALKKTFTLPSTIPIKTKNLTHVGTAETDADSAWAMSREIYHLSGGEQIKVGRDSSWAAVGSDSIIQFARIKGETLEEWVSNWSNYSEQEKRKVYDDKICHELNIFIKFKDNDFFERVARPFISNKIAKTFVDYCLLEDPKFVEFTSIGPFHLLNEFEKVLLVWALKKNGDDQKAKEIAEYMDAQSKQNKVNYEDFKNQFDSVIEAKASTSRYRGGTGGGAGQSLGSYEECFKMEENEYACERGMMLQAQQCADEDDCMYEEKQMNMRKNFKQPFKEMEKTKEYTETTYQGLNEPRQSNSLIYFSPFWASAALHFGTGVPFRCENFMYLTKKVEFTLALALLPLDKQANFDLSNESEQVAISATSHFVVFVRELKSQPYSKKFGVLMNQRFFNPDDRHYYEEDGTKIEKEVKEFIRRRPYCVQTLVTNTSGTSLELQLLIDIPEGSIPLLSHECTQIQSLTLEPYTTKSFERNFYFPESGEFKFYPANACRASHVIAKAEGSPKSISVKDQESVRDLNTLEDALKSGDDKVVLEYLRTKNIFDSKIFSYPSILWMLKDKNFFQQAIKIFRTRKYYEPEFWVFGYLHQDMETIAEYENASFITNPYKTLTRIANFQYFPYYSPRAHRFLNENKSTIRNTQFRNTYYHFLFMSLFSDPQSPKTRLAFIYYLLLQDRIDDAQALANRLTKQERAQHELQFDYIDAFIDMYKGSPSFNKAREISKKYEDYAVETWRKMFKEIGDSLKEYDQESVLEEKKEVHYQTSVMNDGHQLRINVPPETEVNVNIFKLNLELYFSNFPFGKAGELSSATIPNETIVLKAGEAREERIQRQDSFKDCLVEVTEWTEGSRVKKVSSLLWSNPKLKTKVQEEKGVLQVFYEGKKLAGCYCKVYQMKRGEIKFYRDGYTDIAGCFKYALANLDGISGFSVLAMSEHGGVAVGAKPPSTQGYF